MGDGDRIRIPQSSTIFHRIELEGHRLIGNGHALRPVAVVIAGRTPFDRVPKRIDQPAAQPADEIDDPIAHDPFVVMLIPRENDIRSPLGERPLHVLRAPVFCP